MNYFLGLTFAQNYLQFKKIDSFRKRFDAKYSKSNLLQMTLLPPFALPIKDQSFINEMNEHMAEVLEGHLQGLDEINSIVFKGLDFRTGRKGIIYLRPIIPIDLIHCQEALYELLSNYGVHFKNRKRSRNKQDFFKVFLPLGRFSDDIFLETALQNAKIEFSGRFVLQAKTISLFENLPGQWIQRKTLFDFEQNDHSFYGEEKKALKGPIVY